MTQAKKEQSATIKPIALAEMTGMRPQQIFQMIRNGSMPAIKDDKGHNILLVADVIEWLESRESTLKTQLEKTQAMLNMLR